MLGQVDIMRISFLLTVTVLITLAAVPAMAELYTFTNDHCTDGCGSSPFGTVNVTDVVPGTVHIVVDLFNGNKFVNTGFDIGFGFNLIGDPTIGVSGLNAGFSLFSTTAATGDNIKFDGFGLFEYGIVCDICGSGASTPQSGPLTFNVTAAGLTAASFYEKSTIPPGDTQAYFAVDILSGTTGKTGPVGAPGEPTNNSTSTVPEPSAIVLLGSVGLALGYVIRKRRAA
jgi:hypothetical protein